MGVVCTVEVGRGRIKVVDHFHGAGATDPAHPLVFPRRVHAVFNHKSLFSARCES
jgi:hypothetical protein